MASFGMPCRSAKLQAILFDDFATARTHLQTFGIPIPHRNFGHSFMFGRRLERQPWNDDIWDLAAVGGGPLNDHYFQ